MAEPKRRYLVPGYQVTLLPGKVNNESSYHHIIYPGRYLFLRQ